LMSIPPVFGCFAGATLVFVFSVRWLILTYVCCPVPMVPMVLPMLRGRRKERSELARVLYHAAHAKSEEDFEALSPRPEGDESDSNTVSPAKSPPLSHGGGGSGGDDNDKVIGIDDVIDFRNDAG
jgi:hypothetical protein